MCSAYLEELGGDTLEGVGGPLTEPVNGAAVHQAGELAQAGPAPIHMCNLLYNLSVTFLLTCSVIWYVTHMYKLLCNLQCNLLRNLFYRLAALLGKQEQQPQY